MTIQGWPKFSRPLYIGRLADLQKQFDLLGKERIVIFEAHAEERVSFTERSPTDDEFGAASRYQIQRGEFLKHPNRICSAQNRYSARQAYRFSTGCSCRQDGCRCRIEKFGTVVLADAEDVEPYTVRDLNFFQQIRHSVRRR